MPKDLCALIGPNGAGKSNILRALQVLLGETYPSERSFDKDDFFQKDQNKEIRIRIWFSDPLKEVKLTPFGSRGKVAVAITSLELTHTKDPTVSFPTQFTAYDAHGNKYWASGEVKNQISFIYIPSERELNKEMTISQWTLIGKIMKKINENFRANPDPTTKLSEVETNFRASMKKPQSILESDFSTDLTYLKFKDEFTKICGSDTQGLSGGFKLGLEIYDPLFYYKTVQITGIEDGGEFNALELGSGVQNLILISLFKTYAHLMKQNAILAIEEPEIYLYPQAQRQLYKNMRSMTEEHTDGTTKTQVFYTTHNPNFVSAQRATEIELIHKDSDTGTYVLGKDGTVTDTFLRSRKYQIYSHFNTERNEIFFANKIVLVEGPSDKILISKLCENTWNINLDQKGVALTECGGKTGVAYFVGVCKLMGMNNYFAMWDEDSESSSTLPILQKVLEDGNGCQLESNLEVYINNNCDEKINTAGNKIANADVWAENVEPGLIPENLNKVRDFILSI